MSLLSSDQIESEFKKLPVEWAKPAGNRLERSFRFADFAEALSFVNRLGEVAESLNHHPDIRLSYGEVTVILTTHSQGGLTHKDFEFAKKIEEL